MRNVVYKLYINLLLCSYSSSTIAIRQADFNSRILGTDIGAIHIIGIIIMITFDFCNHIT